MSFLTQESFNVHQALKNYGIEAPFLKKNKSLKLNKKKIKKYIGKIINLLNLNINNDSLSNTPERIAKMYVEETFFGLDYNNFPEISLIENKMNLNEMITVRNIHFISICEHHFLIIDGKVTISYFPQDKIIGLSTINQIVYFFSKRPQIQERFTKQILVALQVLLKTKNVAVLVTANHYCVRDRGIRDLTSELKTISFGGFFESNKEIKKEFLYNFF